MLRSIFMPDRTADGRDSGPNTGSLRPCIEALAAGFDKPSVATYLSMTSPGGGIGRRAGFRYQWRKPWRFESSPGHHACAGSAGDTMTIRLHRGDLPDLSHYTGPVAIATEPMGLDPLRDRLCVVQLSPGDGSADVVQIPHGASDAPNLKRLLADNASLKIFHFARFDLLALYRTFGVMAGPVYCTKIASRLA